MRYFVFVLLFVSLPPAQEVKHAPTVEQCRADQRLWIDKLEKSPPTTLPDFDTLTDWHDEMADCQVVDPENHYLYFNLEAEVVANQANRLLKFIIRHSLGDKFREEDKAGKR